MNLGLNVEVAEDGKDAHPCPPPLQLILRIIIVL